MKTKCKHCTHELVLGWVSLKHPEDKAWHHKLDEKHYRLKCDCEYPMPIEEEFEVKR